MRFDRNTKEVQFFQRMFGREPSIAAFAPVRVQLLGDHTDYNLGWTLSAAVEQGVTLIGAPRNDSTCVLHSHHYRETASIDLRALPRKSGRWLDYPMGTLQELGKLFPNRTGLDACIFSTVPPGGGVSSSAAVEGATALFALASWDLTDALSPIEIARLCRRVENNYIGAPTGILDQCSSMLGKPGQALLLDCRSEDYELLPFDPKGYTLFLVNSGVKHDLAAGDGYRDRVRECAEAVTAISDLTAKRKISLRDVTLAEFHRVAPYLSNPVHYMRARHVLEENERVLAGRQALLMGNLPQFVNILNTTFDSCRYFYQNSCPEIDCIVTSARTYKGPVAAKITGAGWGGAVLVLCQTDAYATVTRRIRDDFVARFPEPPEFYDIDVDGCTEVICGLQQ